jgi:hypothetical protein
MFLRRPFVNLPAIMIVVAETKEDRIEAVHEGGGQLAND